MTPDGFRRLADHLPQALLLLSPSGRVLVANRHARRQLGTLEGRVLPDLAQDPVRFRRYLELCGRGSDALPGSLLLDGSRPDEPLRCDCSVVQPGRGGQESLLLLRIRSRPDAAERFVLLNDQIERLHREIRLREEAEAEREVILDQERHARAAAEEASRLKDEFLATVSHELRTPLNAIKGWAHLLRMRQDDPELLRRGLETIEKNTDVQSQLVEDLLDVSRIITGRIRLSVQPVDLTTIVRDAVEVVQPAANAKGVRIQLVAADGECVVHGDPDRLRQIVWNLVSNGVKFTPRSGRVQVILRRINSHVEIEVSDTGEGIAPEVLPYVFDRFRQADASTTRRHGGLGLGLAIVRHLVELHGGLVVADSDGEGRGAAFTVSLPVPAFQKPQAVSGPLAEDREAPAEAPVEDLDLSGLRILLVEDDGDSRYLLAQILSGAGARVTAVATSPEALEALGEHPPDVLVSDIEMPGEDGYTLIRKLRDREGRRREGRTPAVAVTAYATGEYRLRALRAGFQSFVAKPVNPAELVTVVASTAGRL